MNNCKNKYIFIVMGLLLMIWSCSSAFGKLEGSQDSNISNPDYLDSTQVVVSDTLDQNNYLPQNGQHDSIFVKRIIDGDFFEQKESIYQDYLLVVQHCISHNDEQYDEAFSDGLYDMIKRFPEKLSEILNIIDALSDNQRKIAYENLITYIVSSWIMQNHYDSLELDLFYNEFPFFKRSSELDSILSEQFKNYP